MKKLTAILALCFIGFNLSAQIIDEKAGKTYYYYDETTKKKLKEVYHHKDMIKIVPDKNYYGSYRDTIIYVKHGPYTLYDEQGNLKCSGYFHKDKKDSIWKYYDVKGALLKTERWKIGKQIN